MKKLILATLLASFTLSATPVFAGDACEMVLCMFGKLSGASPSECDSPVKDFYDIKKFSKKGKFKADATSDARDSAMDGCPSADEDSKKKITDKFGKAFS